MIRLPNPKSDIFEYLTITGLLADSFGTGEFTPKECGELLAKRGIISSQQDFGASAFEKSSLKKQTLDGVYNQAKAISEILRYLGIATTTSDQHTFKLTLFGRFVGNYQKTDGKTQKEILLALQYSILNINFRHPQK